MKTSAAIAIGALLAMIVALALVVTLPPISFVYGGL